VPGLEVVGSRFVLQGHRILDSRDEARVVEELRLICHHTKYNVTVFHPYFIYFDQVYIHWGRENHDPFFTVYQQS
jgi:hypothetical protein